ncbi:hypothetical protein OG897_26740 [Streptomyces sp. NBC_00237]|uniref:hypothetical protein n=1 Tax=Streptomyces sp. NBC_00237 TaxID=2975687 RepID=UPI0022550B25|nr:hypothetical protein [Streptomyces sp. NBC_00237]MCX5205042.1 hypothetical protein [Streptomyces sp. NBC_00237]
MSPAVLAAGDAPAAPAAREPFPFLGPELDMVEDLPHARLSCWLHCLRDALYAAGHRDTVRALAQALNFVVERDADGNVLTLYGGIDTDYHEPVFQRGLTASWVTMPTDGAAALHRITRELDRGHAVPVSPDLSGMRHSEFYRVPFVGYPHTFLVHRLDDGTAWIADRNDHRRAAFTDHRGTMPAEELRQGMAGGTILVWETAAPAPEGTGELAGWEAELTALLARSVRQLREPAGPEEGLAGLRALPGVIEELAGSPRMLRQRVAGPLQRQVAGDRRLLAAVLEGEAARADSPHASGRDRELARLLRESSDAIMALARTVHLNSRSWSAEAHALCRQHVARIHAWDARTTDLMAARVDSGPAVGADATPAARAHARPATRG